MELSGSGARQVFIRSTAVNVVVREVRVTVNRHGVPDSGSYASVSLTSAAGASIGLVERFVRVGGDADLKIAGIEAFGSHVISPTEFEPGRIGLPGSSSVDEIVAADIGSIRAVGGIYSRISIESPVAAGTSPLLGDIVLVQSTGSGRLLANVVTNRGGIGTIDFAGGHIGDDSASPAILPTITSYGQTTRIEAKSISANITVEGATGCGCLRRIAATDGSITGSVTTAILGNSSDATSGLYVANGRVDADVTISSNLRGALSVSGTVPGGVAIPASRRVTIRAGVQANAAPITIGGQHQGQIIINGQSGVQIWESTTTINGQLLSPSDTFEFTQSSADLGGGAIGMAPFRLWKSDCHPVWKDNLTLGGGDGLYETAFVPSGAKPVKMRFYGPIKRGAGYASWTEAFVVQCRPLGSEGQCN